LPGADAGKPDVKGAAEKAVKKSPLGFMNVGELAFDLPGSGVSKDDLPNNVKPGDAAGLPEGPTAKPPSLPNLPKVKTETISSQVCKCACILCIALGTVIIGLVCLYHNFAHTASCKDGFLPCVVHS